MYFVEECKNLNWRTHSCLTNVIKFVQLCLFKQELQEILSTLSHCWNAHPSWKLSVHWGHLKLPGSQEWTCSSQVPQGSNLSLSRGGGITSTWIPELLISLWTQEYILLSDHWRTFLRCLNHSALYQSGDLYIVNCHSWSYTLLNSREVLDLV